MPAARWASPVRRGIGGALVTTTLRLSHALVLIPVGSAMQSVSACSRCFTPADVHFGRHLELDRVRQRALDAAYAARPERFVKARPTSPSVPDEVWINRPAEHTVTIELPVAQALALPGGRGDPRGEGPRLPHGSLRFLLAVLRESEEESEQ